MGAAVKDSKCLSCGAAILWKITAAGARMPVDAEPTTEGNLVEDETTGRLRVIAGPLEVPPGTPIFMSHYATCPDARNWRGRKR